MTIDESQEPKTIALYDRLKTVEPLREVLSDEADEEDVLGVEGRTMSEQAEFSPRLSDVQSALKLLLPKLQGYLNVLQVSRVFPDTYNALFNLLVKDMLDTDPNLTFGEACAYVYTALSIAIDGEGRIDVIGLYGKVAEQELEKEKNKLIGA